MTTTPTPTDPPRAEVALPALLTGAESALSAPPAGTSAGTAGAESGRRGRAAGARGPLGPLAGVPGLTGALVRAALAALGQTAGMVLLAAGLAHAVARIAGLAGGSPAGPLLLAAAGAVLRAGAGAVGEVLAARDTRRAEAQLRRDLLARLATSPAAVEAAGGPGPAAVLASTRLQDLGPALATYLPALAQTIVVPPVLLVALAVTDLVSAVVVAVTLPLVPVFMALVGLYTRDQTTDAARSLDRLAGHVAELVRGLPVLVGLGRAADQAAALAELGETTRTRTLATLRLAFLSALVLELLATLSVAIVAVAVGIRLVDGGMPLTVGLTALLLAPEAFAPLRALGSAFHSSDDAALAATEARTVLAAPAAPTTSSGSSAAAISGSRAETSSGSGAPRGLSLGGLSVAYPGRSRPALEPLDLTVAPGELVALRGRSGAGKSTVLGALAGTLPTSAQVSGTVAGVPAGRVAVVPQHPRTTGRTVTDELLRHAAAPEGTDGAALAAEALADVGATGVADRECRTLSPGELQRVAVARALVRVRRGARLLLLDEPTAHLDATATALVAGVLAGLRGRVTVLLVTHDPALAALADRTVVVGGHAPALPRPAAVRAAVPAPAVVAPLPPAPAPAGGTATTGGLTWPRRALVRAVLAGTGSAAAGIALTALSGWLIVRAAQMPPILTLLVAIVGVRFFGMGRAFLRWTERLTAHDAALRLAADTRVRVWSALSRQGIAADRTPGSALARVVGDVELLQDASVRVLTPPLVAAAVLTGTTLALALLDPATALTVLAVCLLAAGLVVLAHRGVDRGAARREAELRVETLREAVTVLDGATDLRAHGVAGSALDDVTRLAARQAVAARSGVRAAALGGAAASAGAGLAAVLAALVGWQAVQAGTLSGPAVAVLALAPLALAEPLTGLVAALQRRGAWDDARARVTAVLEAPVPADPPDPLPAPAAVRELATEQVTAGWPGRPDVLRDLDLDARAGTGWLVVRGPSGSGKSTLLAVLMAALRPRAGRYTVDGADTAALRGDDVRAGIAWLPQEAHVFASTVRANLAMAAPRGELAGADGEARMHAALAAVGLSGLVAGMPAGLDTPVGAGGTGLSGGERRRLAAARALLADRDVVLLDEPTAHLDQPTAQALVRDLRAALAGRTVVCVSHDPVETDGDTVLQLGPREPARTA